MIYVLSKLLFKGFYWVNSLSFLLKWVIYQLLNKTSLRVARILEIVTIVGLIPNVEHAVTVFFSAHKQTNTNASVICQVVNNHLL